MRFDDYVERCLYDPDEGFYATSGNAGGRRGDFITSVEVGPLFGAVLARYLDAVWDELERPEEFTVVEAGAGRGALAAAVLAAGPRCVPALRYRTVERSARLRAEQRDLLGDRVEVSDVMPDSRFVGVVLANELLDNISPRIVEKTSDGWCELFVDGESEVLVACDSPPSVIRNAAVAGVRLPWCEGAGSWVEAACELVRDGAVLLIDYGVRSTAELAHRQWLRTHRAHQRGDDPLRDPGSFDITVDVAFDQLPAGAKIATQRQFLRTWGIDDLVAEGRRIWAARAAVGDLAAVRARSRVSESEALLDPDGLGDFLVGEWRIRHDADAPVVLRPSGV